MGVLYIPTTKRSNMLFKNRNNRRKIMIRLVRSLIKKYEKIKKVRRILKGYKQEVWYQHLKNKVKPEDWSQIMAKMEFAENQNIANNILKAYKENKWFKTFKNIKTESGIWADRMLEIKLPNTELTGENVKEDYIWALFEEDESLNFVKS
jgi:16S rRNA C967 or C1407 C5-methylase (RsmB/RsmF family)